MKNPIDYFKDSFKSVNTIKNEILSKKTRNRYLQKAA